VFIKNLLISFYGGELFFIVHQPSNFTVLKMIMPLSEFDHVPGNRAFNGLFKKYW